MTWHLTIKRGCEKRKTTHFALHDTTCSGSHLSCKEVQNFIFSYTLYWVVSDSQMAPPLPSSCFLLQSYALPPTKFFCLKGSGEIWSEGLCYTSCSARGPVLALCSGITPKVFSAPYAVLANDPGLALCKASILTPVLSLRPLTSFLEGKTIGEGLERQYSGKVLVLHKVKLGLVPVTVHVP